MAKKRSDSAPANGALDRYRSRMRGRGMVRVEVQVTNEDAPLVRAVAAALANPERRSEARALLRERFGPERAGFKAFIESVPLEGVRITRSRTRSRRVDL